MDTDELREALLELLDAGLDRRDWKRLKDYPHVEASVDHGEIVLRNMVTHSWNHCRRDAYRAKPTPYCDQVQAAADCMEKEADNILDLEAHARNIIEALGVDKGFFAD